MQITRIVPNIATEDLAAAKVFYGGLLGLTLAMDHGWILTFVGVDQASPQVSFAVEGVHPHDVATILDEGNVAIRAGHHCAQPLMELLEVPATARASFGVYNGPADVAALVRGIERVTRIFG